MKKFSIKKLNEYRKEKGLTEKEFRDLCRIPSAYLEILETEDIPPNADMVAKFCDVLELESIEMLYDAHSANIDVQSTKPLIPNIPVKIWDSSTKHHFTNAHQESWVAEELDNAIRFTGDGLNNSINLSIEHIEKQISTFHEQLTNPKEQCNITDSKGEVVCLDEDEVYWFLSILKSAHNALCLVTTSVPV